MTSGASNTHDRRYSISEVARMFDINESTLRYWEKEFRTIAPKKSMGGTRYYEQKDIKAIETLHHLLKEKKMTIAGAKQALRHNRNQVNQDVEIIAKLKKIKAELLEMQQAFEQLENRP